MNKGFFVSQLNTILTVFTVMVGLWFLPIFYFVIIVFGLSAITIMKGRNRSYSPTQIYSLAF